MEDRHGSFQSQVTLLQDFNINQVAAILQRSRSWVAKNRGLFTVYTVPGRGKNGAELRFTRASVEDYVYRVRGIVAADTVDNIISEVKAERAL